ncbi:unnamed protein product [Effrenium voratum]|nr:unnamed protein product [Effrenium voratum]
MLLQRSPLFHLQTHSGSLASPISQDTRKHPSSLKRHGSLRLRVQSLWLVNSVSRGRSRNSLEQHIRQALLGCKEEGRVQTKLVALGLLSTSRQAESKLPKFGAVQACEALTKGLAMPGSRTVHCTCFTQYVRSLTHTLSLFRPSTCQVSSLGGSWVAEAFLQAPPGQHLIARRPRTDD